MPIDNAGHDAVLAVGFDPEDAQTLGIGYAPKGMMRGLVAVPIRLPAGELVGYIGIEEARLPKSFHLSGEPETNVVRLPRKTA